MNRVVIQIPVTASFRKEAEKAVEKRGFSSLQDYIRLLLHKTIYGMLDVKIEEPEAIQLSAKAIKRYNKMHDDIVNGRVKTKAFSDINSMMKYLNK